MITGIVLSLHVFICYYMSLCVWGEVTGMFNLFSILLQAKSCLSLPTEAEWKVRRQSLEETESWLESSTGWGENTEAHAWRTVPPLPWIKSLFCVLLHLVTQSCPTLCEPMDGSLPGSSVHGILQARILEWVAMPFSWGSSQPRTRTQVSLAARFLTIWATREAHEYWSG